MSVNRRAFKWGLFLGGTVLFVFLSVQTTMAAGPIAAWRPYYDTAMRWLNFIILVAIIVKYGRAPVKHFLQIRRDEIKQEIQELEKVKSQLLGKVNDSRQEWKIQEERLGLLRERIVADGEKKKRALIEEARQESASLIKETRRKIDHCVDDAKKRLKSELVDMAVDSAMQMMPAHITDADNDKILDNFFIGITRTKE